MHQRPALLVAALGLALGARAAHADPPRIGIEMGQTLSGLRGLGARVDLGPVQLDALVDGVARHNPFVTGPRTGGVRVLVPLARWRDGWIGALAGGTLARFDAGDGHTGQHWAIEGGAHVEWFALPALSLGLDLGVVHGSGDPFVTAGAPPPAPITQTSLGGAAAGGTLTFWF